MANEDEMISEGELDALLGEDPREQEIKAGGIELIKMVYNRLLPAFLEGLKAAVERPIDGDLVSCTVVKIQQLEQQVKDQQWILLGSEERREKLVSARFLIPEQSAVGLARVMLGEEPGDPEMEFNEVYSSALSEIFEQISPRYGKKFQEFTGFNYQLKATELYRLNSDELLKTVGEEPVIRIEYNIVIGDTDQEITIYELQPASMADNLTEQLSSGKTEANEVTEAVKDDKKTGSAEAAGDSGQKDVKSVDFPQFEATEGGQPAGDINMLMDVPMEVSVELGRARLRVKEILDLGAGSIIELERLAGEPVDLLINGRLVARGEVVVIDENFGVRVTSVVSAMERLQQG